MHDLSLYVLELIENSLRAGASRIAVHVTIDGPRDELAVVVDDDGPGLAVTPEQATDPFFTTKDGKRTGLGLPLFREAAEAAGGRLAMTGSDALGGHRVEAVVRLSHVDRPPLGDVVQTVAVMAATNPGVELTLDVTTDAEACHATGAELVASGPAAARCARILGGADAAGARTPAASAPPTPTSAPTTPTVDATERHDKRQRSMG